MVRVFSHWFPANTIVQFVFDAVLLFLSVVFAAVWFDRGRLPLDLVLPSALLFALAMVALNTVLGLYRHDVSRSRLQTLARAVMSWLLALPVAYVIFAALPWGEAGQDTFKMSALLALGALTLARSFSARIGGARMLGRRVLVLGTGPEAAGVEHSFKRSDSGARVIGFVGVQNSDVAHVPPASILPKRGSLIDMVRESQAEEVIVAVRERRNVGLPLQELLDCKLAGVPVLDLSSHFERAHGQVRLEFLHPSWLIFGGGFRQGPVRVVVKRLFDMFAALVLLVALSPVMLVTAIMIVRDSGLPVLFGQERVGQGGRVFRVLKFRSMRVDTEGDGKSRWGAANDDLLTRAGRVIHRLHIDELPQLINVLRGDMSMVGPRPERPFFVDQLAQEIPFYAARHSLKPGITGWAQVRYHYGASLEDAAQKLQYDLYYVKNHSLFLDAVVLFETVGVALTRAGAQ